LRWLLVNRYLLMNVKQGQFYTKERQIGDLAIPRVVTFALLAAIVWVANFWHSASFGLYEDDWVRIPTIIGLSWEQIFHKVVFDTGFQGRPFHDGLIFLFSFLGIKLGGLPYAYAIGFAIVTINAWLFYLLLEKLYGDPIFAWTGSLTFCLFPADTTRDYLTHSLGIQPSLAFLLIAFHCYLSKFKQLSYLIVFLCLVSYEPLVTVFFVAPLFNRKWDAKLPKELIKHSLILIAVIVGAGILRKLVGENQISNFTPQSVMLLVLNPIFGSITSLAMLIYRPIETLFKLNGELVLFCLPAFLIFSYLLSNLKIKPLAQVFSLRTFDRAKRFSRIPNVLKPYAKPLITGASALVLAYPLAMTTFGFAMSGRTARVHVAAIVGTSILAACLCSVTLAVANKHGRKRLAIFGLAGLFALLVGFGLRVQQDYQLMWQHQRGFWTDVVRLCPDVTEGTVIFVEPTGLRDTRQPIPFRESRGVSDPKQIKGIEWELPHVMAHIYQFPAQWEWQPRAYRLQSNWQSKLAADGNLLHVSAAIDWITEPEMKREVASTNVIFLETTNGRLTRRTKPLVIGNRQFALKQPSLSGLPPFEKKYLYNYLIQKPNEQPIDYLIK
jgi:hypothetical protein